MAKGIGKSKDGRLIMLSVNLPQDDYEVIKKIAEEMELSQSVVGALLIQNSLEDPSHRLAIKVAIPLRRMMKRLKAAHQKYQMQVGLAQEGLFE